MQLRDGGFVYFCATNTLLLLVVGKLQHYSAFQGPQHNTPCSAPPHFLALAAGSQVVSSGDDAPSSWAVRPSTRSRRGRRGSGHSPRSSPPRTRRADEGQESSDSGTQGSEGSDGSSQDSRQSALPAEDPQQRTSKVEEAPSDSRARWQRQSATSPKQQHHEQPRPAGSPGMGAPPPWRSTSQSVDARLEQARRRKTAARETIVRRRHRL